MVILLLTSEGFNAKVRLAEICQRWSLLGRFRLKHAAHLIEFDPQACSRISQC